MLSLLLMVALPYVSFVLLGEQFNPWVKPKNHFMRFRWRFGRRVGLLLAIVLGINFLLVDLYDWPQIQAAVTCAFIATPFLLLLLVKFISEKKNY